MLIAYLAFGLILGVFMTFIWSSRGWANCLIKTGWVVWTLWSAGMLAIALAPMLGNARLL